MKAWHMLSVLTPLCVVAGCEVGFLGIGDGVSMSIRSDRTRYDVRPIANGFAVDMVLSLTNTGDVRILGANCAEVMDLELQKRENGQWVRAWRPYLPLCLSEPLVIRPGQTHRHPLAVTAYVPGRQGGPELEVASLEGTFRVVFQMLVTAPEDAADQRDTRISERHRTSNTFELVLR